MNKKFFTLIASAFMLVASLGTVNAALGTGSTAPKMDDDAQKGMYHLKAVRQGAPGVEYVVSVDPNGILKIEPFGTYNSNNIANALWCVSVTAQEEGANPRFDFVNRAFGGILAVDLEDFTDKGSIDIAQGSNKGWKFSSTYATALQSNRPLTTYSEADKVLVLTYDGVSSNSNVGVIETTATPTGDYTTGGTPATGVYDEDDVLLFTIVQPTKLYLTAANYNTRFGTEPTNDSIKLVFNPDRNSPNILNPWTDYALKAVKFDGSTPANALNFKRADGQYLRVDTAWTNAEGVKFLAFGWGDIEQTAIEDPVGTHDDIRKQYNFTVEYDFSTDGLDIRVEEAYMKDPDAASDERWATSATVESTSANLRVKLQDLDDRRLVTIGKAPINTKILFNLGSCTASSPNFTSLENDLYLISRKTASGVQYLAVPIYTFNGDRDTIPQWISLQDNVDPKQMPAYQWVVEKTRTNNASTSPIKITNREFPRVRSKASAQLLTGTPTIPTTKIRIYGTNSLGDIDNADLDFNLTTANFGTPLDKSIKENETLGYFFIDPLTAQTYTYEFNYLHRYNYGEYLGVRSANDSSLVVAESANKSMFKLDLLDANGAVDVNGAVEKYGYVTDKVADLKQLKRVRYAIKIPAGSGLLGSATESKYIVVDRETRYAVSAKYGAINYGRFYLKTNNTRDGKDYYAMLDMRSGHLGGINFNFVKLGIADNSLWALRQTPDESRTSAFAINRYSEPLYRRFDGVTTGNNVLEPFGESEGENANAPQWLKFTKYNNLGNEFLFENSQKGVGSNFGGADDKYPATTENEYRQGIKDKSISFLGLYNRRQFEEGANLSYTFYVDTAYVRGETPMPQYMLAVNPKFVEGGKQYQIVTDSIWDENGLIRIDRDTFVTEKPSYTRGSWVFNASDSVGFDSSLPFNADYQGKFAYGAERTTRLAFVDGIHYGDTFYVVRGQVNGVIDSAFFWNLPVADKHYLGANTHYEPRWYNDGWNYNLTGGKWVVKPNTKVYNENRNGKSMVFQFRLVDPANSRRFLIESQREIYYDANGVTNIPAAPAPEIAPMDGKWLKIQNGVPVISDYINIIEATQNGAEIFDVLGGVENGAVANEKATVSSSVKVLGGVNSVTILNAGGKKVAISNILGQTVANRVASSDNVTIALPKGIVVVAVEGEAAVKAIVK